MLPNELKRRKRANSPFDIPYIGEIPHPLNTLQWIFSIFDFNEPDEGPDKYGLYNGLICTAEQADYLFFISWLSCLSASYGLVRGYYNVAAAPIGVWLTSMMYWHNPTDSWRRILDISYVTSGTLYTSYHAIGAEKMVGYFTFAGIGCFLYWGGWYCHRNGSTWGGTFCQCGVHICAFLANVWLYSGRIY